MHTFGQSPHTPGLDCVRTKLKAPDIFSNVNLFMRVYFLLSGLHYCSGYCLVFNIVYRSHFPFVISGRMALLVTLFLVLVNIFNSVTGQAPKSEGLTAVETWVVMCILHVFCVLLEYAVILKIIQNEKRRIVAFRRAMAQQQFYAAVGAGIPRNY